MRAVVEHIGRTVSTGHYVSHVAGPSAPEGRRVRFEPSYDDSKAFKRKSLSAIVARGSYMVLYERAAEAMCATLSQEVSPPSSELFPTLNDPGAGPSGRVPELEGPATFGALRRDVVQSAGKQVFPAGQCLSSDCDASGLDRSVEERSASTVCDDVPDYDEMSDGELLFDWHVTAVLSACTSGG